MTSDRLSPIRAPGGLVESKNRFRTVLGAAYGCEFLDTVLLRLPGWSLKLDTTPSIFTDSEVNLGNSSGFHPSLAVFAWF